MTFITLLFATANVQAATGSGLYTNVPFAMNEVAEPHIPTYNIADETTSSFRDITISGVVCKGS